MSTIDIGIGEPAVLTRAPSAIAPKPSPAPVMVSPKPVPLDDDVFYIGSVKIETHAAGQAEAVACN